MPFRGGTTPPPQKAQFYPAQYNYNGIAGCSAGKTIVDRRLGSLEASDDLSVVQECFVGAFLLLLMFMVYLFNRRVAATKTFGPNGTRIVRKMAPTFMRKLL